jgi:hypothetical protein
LNKLAGESTNLISFDTRRSPRVRAVCQAS